MILMNNKMLTFIQRKGRDSIRLSMKLSEILKAGVREMDGCYFLNYFLEENSQYSSDVFEDLTSYESFMNGFHVEDYCTRHVIENSFHFSVRLAKLLKGTCKYRIVLSIDKQNDCYITFHSVHQGEPEWIDQTGIDFCSECIAIFM